MAKRGRPRKPSTELKLSGEYREDRHGNRADELVCSGKPVMPAGLTVSAAAAWRHLVEATPEGIYGEQDIELLTAYCQLWGRYVELNAAGDVITALKVLNSWLRLGCDLGVGPVNRCKLEIQKADDKQEALRDFLTA